MTRRFRYDVKSFPSSPKAMYHNHPLFALPFSSKAADSPRSWALLAGLRRGVYLSLWNLLLRRKGGRKGELEELSNAITPSKLYRRHFFRSCRNFQFKAMGSSSARLTRIKTPPSSIVFSETNFFSIMELKSSCRMTCPRSLMESF